MDLVALAAAVPPVEAAGAVLGLLYLVLAVRENVWCWPVALVSSLLTVVVLAEERLYSEAGLNVFYAAMAVYGWRQWQRGARRGGAELPISVWPVRRHALALAAVLAATFAIGAVTARAGAAFPYLDALVTAGSVVTTYMVAKKVLENWLYWLVFDGIALYLYLVRELYWFAALFAVYLVLVVLGLYRWHRDWRAQPALAA